MVNVASFFQKLIEGKTKRQNNTLWVTWQEQLRHTDCWCDRPKANIISTKLLWELINYLHTVHLVLDGINLRKCISCLEKTKEN